MFAVSRVPASAMARAAPLQQCATGLLSGIAPSVSIVGRLGAALPSSMPAGPQTVQVRHLMTKRRRKEIRKSKAKDMREILAFAKFFDPMRTAKLQIKQTLERLGYDFRMDETVSEGLTVDFALVDWYCAFELVAREHYVLPTSPNASDDVGLGPGERPKRNQPGDRLTLPHQTGFIALPPDWLNPVRGLVLDKDTAARHAAIRAKGWKLVAVPQPQWEFAAGKERDAHYARRDLLLSMTLPLVPFEPRALGTSATQEAASAASASKAKERSSKMSEKDTAEAAVKRAAKSARASDLAEETARATVESATGASRRARRIAKLKVSAAEEAKEA